MNPRQNISHVSIPAFLHRRRLVLCVLLSGHAHSSIAEVSPNLTEPKIVAPEKITGIPTLQAEQVIKLLTSANPPLLIDARIKKDREHGYIESSISLPDIDTSCTTLKQLASDKKQHIVFYCNGVQCGRSVISIKIARSCGYQNLSWFKGGFAEWNNKGYQYRRNR